MALALLFGSSYVVGFSGAMMPGSLLTYCVQRVLKRGWRDGFVMTAGHAVLELVLVLLLFAGLGTLLQSVAAQIIIGLLGGLYMAWMGVDMARTALRNRAVTDMQEGDTRAMGAFVNGLVISATNPYFLIWWAVIGLGFMMQAYTQWGIIGVAVFYVGHICADFTWYGAVSVLISSTRRFIPQAVYRWVMGALGVVLLGLGISFVWRAVMLWV